VKLIGLVGKAGSGKDTVCQILEEKYPSVRMGEIIVEEADRRGVDPTDENLGRIATELRERYGMGAIAERCVPKIRQLEAPVVVVNGIRGMDEVKVFEKNFGRVLLVEIWTPEKLRLERIRSRSRADDVRTLEQLRRRDEREARWGLDEAIERAQYRIENDGSLSDLRARTEALMEKIDRDP